MYVIISVAGKFFFVAYVGFAWVYFWSGGKKPAMKVIFLWGAAKSFLHAGQNQLLAPSEKRHTAKSTTKACKASMLIYLWKTKPWEMSFSSLEWWVGARVILVQGWPCGQDSTAKMGTARVAPCGAALSVWLTMNFICLATFSQPCCQQKGQKWWQWIFFPFLVCRIKRHWVELAAGASRVAPAGAVWSAVRGMASNCPVWSLDGINLSTLQRSTKLFNW